MKLISLFIKNYQKYQMMAIIIVSLFSFLKCTKRGRIESNIRNRTTNIFINNHLLLTQFSLIRFCEVYAMNNICITLPLTFFFVALSYFTFFRQIYSIVNVFSEPIQEMLSLQSGLQILSYKNSHQCLVHIRRVVCPCVCHFLFVLIFFFQEFVLCRNFLFKSISKQIYLKN